MAFNSPLGDYLRARRAATQPEDVGLVRMPGRRVEGLRREEVAELAGVSSDYYLRLEQGRDRQPSFQVLQAIARALKLDASAVDYMLRLTHVDTGVGRSDDMEIAADVVSGLDEMVAQWPFPAYVTNRNLRILSSNESARQLVPEMWNPGGSLIVAIFGDAWRRIDQHWECNARRAVAALRFASDPRDSALRDLVGLLSMRDADFRRIWSAHEAAPLGACRLQLNLGGEERFFDQRTLVMPDAEGSMVTVLREAESSGERQEWTQDGEFEGAA
ncbi:helix-turn-helix domain-containing protein [Protaetiibacter intestinalis]|uniref:XRE family transcriptional regulator n=1 Tax=Protaetiibacter intestinalis TaxID=2419774 RepID=A0A387B473_9MICO|nr:helix-turn-helix transcriptional regulator [Protaetiibacter intestinalis]AYF97213.1 XRE family transcriptional regulator [Protaetiibacter intestinalis]